MPDADLLPICLGELDALDDFLAHRWLAVEHAPMLLSRSGIASQLATPIARTADSERNALLDLLGVLVEQAPLDAETRAALSHSTASRPSAAAKARASAIVIFVLFGMVRSLPFVSVAPGASRAPPLGNTQDTPGNGVGFGSSKGRKCRAQTPRGLQALVPMGLSAFRGCAGEVRFSTPCGGLFTHPTHRSTLRETRRQLPRHDQNRHNPHLVACK